MKLNRIDFSNFRSIKDDKIVFDHNCLILVGDNASGKSNTINAIVGGLDSSKYSISPKDKRKRLPSDPVMKPENFFIRFVFRLSAEEIDSILSDIDTRNLDDLFEVDDKKLSFKEFAYRYFSEGIWKYNIAKQESSAKRWTISDDITVLKNIFQVTRDFTDSEGFIIKKDSFITEENENTSQQLDVDYFAELIGSHITDYVKNNLPQVFYWKYDKNQLLPNKVNIQEFIGNPKSCEPLNNIFKLAGYTNLAQAFEEAMAEDSNYKNLLNNVAAIATGSFSKKWAHFKDATICLAPDGQDILITIKRNTEYNLEDESDGFKRFVSILLMLSTRVDTKDIENALIVIDEPDGCLSPSGCKDLRDLLIKMSENNMVLYSTHSPFMIDRQNIGRHIIVKKDSTTDVTHFEVATEGKYSDNEVLLHAIGTSIFDFVSDTVILFEGSGDQKIFEAAITGEKHKTITKKLTGLGRSFAHGCTGIKHVTPALAFVKDKTVLIFTDSDQPSCSAKDTYIKAHGFQSENWYTFEDLGGEKDETIEDYLTDSFLQKGLDFIGCNKKVSERGGQKVMKFLGNFDRSGDFKNYLYENVTQEDIKLSYFTTILKNLVEKIPKK